MEVIVAASSNKHKISEINAFAEKLGIRIISKEEAGIPDVDVEETGATFEENSFIKANEIMKLTGKPALADDSGLSVDYLSGAPGVYSARFAGDNASDARNNEKLLSLLSDVPYKDRRAHFTSVITVVYPDGRKIVAKGICPGHILTEPHGDGGFGYDPLFVPDGFHRTFAQMPQEEKNKISHRAKALMELERILKEEETDSAV